MNKKINNNIFNDFNSCIIIYYYISFNLQNIVAQENIGVKLAGPSSNKPYGVCGVI